MQNFMEQNNWKLLTMSWGRQILDEKLCNSKTIYHSNAQTYMMNRWALEIVMHNFLPLLSLVLFYSQCLSVSARAFINTALYGTSVVLRVGCALAHKIETLLNSKLRLHGITLHCIVLSDRCSFEKLTHIYTNACEC